MKMKRNLKALRKIIKHPALEFKLLVRARVLDHEGVRLVSALDTLLLLERNFDSGGGFIYLRFGDGEINLVSGGASWHRHQVASRQLREALVNAFRMRGQHVMKGLPIHSNRYGLDNGMTFKQHRQPEHAAERYFLSVCDYFLGEPIYSAVAIHYCLVHERDHAIRFLLKVKSTRCIFVCGDHNDESVIDDILQPSFVVKVPQRDGFSAFETVLAELKVLLNEPNSSRCVVFSAGPLTKTLIASLAYLFPDRFFFDFGSVIEVFHGRTKWGWVREAIEQKGADYWQNVRLALETGKQGGASW